eukprot:gene8297-11228_t
MLLINIWIVLHVVYSVSGQRDSDSSGVTTGLRGKKRRPKRNEVSSGRMMKALTINYPLHIFSSIDGQNIRDWRLPARYSKELVDLSSKDKPYVDISQAQDQEDVWLYENWFYGMKEGVIMESGALNGILFSTSYMFEKFANWTPIHVEADPENYSNLKVNRERGINVNGALCNEPRLLHYSSVGVIPVRGFIEFMSPSFIKKWHGRIYNNKTSINDLPTVQCLPVKLLLKELNVKHVDIWILDVEGAEESVLTGTDFNLVHFNAVAMECDEHDLSKNERKTSILERNGFQCQLIERNCMCKHKDYTASTSPSLSELRKWDGGKRGAIYITPAVVK